MQENIILFFNNRGLVIQLHSLSKRFSIQLQSLSHLQIIKPHLLFSISSSQNSNSQQTRFILKLHQNTINYSYIGDLSVSIRDLHRRKKLVLGLPVLNTTRMVVCMTEFAFIASHCLWTFHVDVYGLLD